MGQLPIVAVGWQPLKSAVPVPVHAPPGEQFALLALGMHLPLGHSESALQ
jgi:hypothetical protein